VDDGLGLGRTARDIHVHGEDFVHAAEEVIRPDEGGAAGRAGPDGHYVFGLGHLRVQADQPVLGLPGHAAGHRQEVGVPRAAFAKDAEALEVVFWREGGGDLDVTAIAGARIEVEDPRRPLPRPLNQAHDAPPSTPEAG